MNVPLESISLTTVDLERRLQDAQFLEALNQGTCGGMRNAEQFGDLIGSDNRSLVKMIEKLPCVFRTFPKPQDLLFYFTSQLYDAFECGATVLGRLANCVQKKSQLMP